MTTDADAMVILANSIDMLAEAIKGLSFSPGGAPPSPGPAQAPVPPSGPPASPGGHSNGGGEDTRIKMSKKVFAICKQNGWDIGDIGERVTGRPVGADSRAWSQSDLAAVLDAFKEWNVG